MFNKHSLKNRARIDFQDKYISVYPAMLDR